MSAAPRQDLVAARVSSCRATPRLSLSSLGAASGGRPRAHSFVSYSYTADCESFLTFDIFQLIYNKSKGLCKRKVTVRKL